MFTFLGFSPNGKPDITYLGLLYQGIYPGVFRHGISLPWECSVCRLHCIRGARLITLKRPPPLLLSCYKNWREKTRMAVLGGFTLF